MNRQENTYVISRLLHWLSRHIDVVPFHVQPIDNTEDGFPDRRPHKKFNFQRSIGKWVNRKECKSDSKF